MEVLRRMRRQPAVQNVSPHLAVHRYQRFDPIRSGSERAPIRIDGVAVAVCHVSLLGSLRSGGNVSDLTPAILEQMKTVKINFLENLPNYTISKIEYIMNDVLYIRFNNTRAEFRKTGRSTKEVVLFHGTNPQNINRYLYSKRH